MYPACYITSSTYESIENKYSGFRVSLFLDPGKIEQTSEPPLLADPETAKAGEIVKEKGSINYVSDGEGNIIPVPKRFEYVGVGTKETGFVIKDVSENSDTNGNEFVWVPVEGMPYEFDRYAFAGGKFNGVEIGIDEATNSKKIKHSADSSDYFVEKKEYVEWGSVEKYGGFYIARYEAGCTEKRTNGNLSLSPKPLFKMNLYPYIYINKRSADSVSNKVYTDIDNSFIGRLCSSYAWDTALKFIETKNQGWATSTSVGYYGTESQTSLAVRKTGYSAACNIYDMGGNAEEWTKETSVSSNSRRKYVARGGTCYSNSAPRYIFPPSGRNNGAGDNGYEYHCFRIALFLY